MSKILKINDAAIVFAKKARPVVSKLNSVLGRFAAMYTAMPLVGYLLTYFICYVISSILDPFNTTAMFSLDRSPLALWNLLIRPYNAIIAMNISLVYVLTAILHFSIFKFAYDIASAFMFNKKLHGVGK